MMVLAMSLGSPILLHGGDGETVRVPEIRKACPLGTTKECTASEDKIQGFLLASPEVTNVKYYLTAVRGGMREKWKKKRRRRMKWNTPYPPFPLRSLSAPPKFPSLILFLSFKPS
eukprot:1344283-Amorphochlora_amoeboformis.AAC.1